MAALNDDSMRGQVLFAKGTLKRLSALAVACPTQLESYLQYTHARLQEQKKVVYAHDREGDFAVWNTGLVDATFAPTYCFCEPAAAADSPSDWRAKAFCTWGRSRYGRRFARALGNALPARATYFSSKLDMVARPPEHVETDYADLACQLRTDFPHVSRRLGVGEGVELEPLLRNAVSVSLARLRYMPTCAVPAWGAPIGIDDTFHCLPLSFGDYLRADAVGVLRDHRLHKLIAPSLALLCAWLVRMPDAGLGWVLESEADAAGDKLEAEAPEAHAMKSQPEPDPRARLTCTEAGMPAYVIHSGNLIGISRRSKGAKPDIALPARHGFEGVSQVQGKFEAQGDELWVFVHEGSNWTLVRHADGTETVLRTRGARERLCFGDRLVFSGSPSFVFGR